MLQRAKDHIQWLSRNNFANSYFRDCYSVWIDLYVLCIDIVARIKALRADRDQVRQLPRALPDVKKDFQSSWKMVEMHKSRELQQFIIHFAGGPDPCGQLRHVHAQDWLKVPTISEDIWADAFENVEKTWPGEAITDANRKKKFAEIDKKISGLKTELEKYPDLPKWQEFVDHWRSMQASCDTAITPQGFELQSSPIRDEIEAFKKLGLGQLVDPQNRYQPAKGY